MIIQGKAYVLGDNIDTDQIIPAHHLVYNLDDPKERKLYGKYALSGVPQEQAGLPKGNIPMVASDADTSKYTVVIGGGNFGCGSSREHAPVAMQMAGIQAVVANSYARIFYRNSVDGGYLMPFETDTRICDDIETGDEIVIDTEKQTLIHTKTQKEYPLNPLGEVADIVKAGGIFEYARKKDLIGA